jgi:RNA polymerase subunit RPABC4/transcription elongation factor Spt4
MADILAQIGDTIGGIFSSPVLQLGIRAIGIYLVNLWLASAYWAFRDMQQRSDNAILPYLAAAGIILFTPLFFVLAVWVYKIVRPHEKIGEVWERNLAEEALLAEVEAIHHCPGCERRVDEEWIICPTCRTRLNRVCPNCSRLVGLDWSLCAWCGKDFERRPVVAAGLDPGPVAHEVTGRVPATLPEVAPRPIPSAAAAVRTTVRPSAAPSRATGSARSAAPGRAAGGVPAAQDPLPER